MLRPWPRAPRSADAPAVGRLVLSQVRFRCVSAASEHRDRRGRVRVETGDRRGGRGACAREWVAGRRAVDRCRVVLSRARADRRAPAIRRRTVGAPVERHDGAVDAPADVRAPRRERRATTPLVPTRTRRWSVWRPVTPRRPSAIASTTTSSCPGGPAPWTRTASRRQARRAAITGRTRRCSRISCTRPGSGFRDEGRQEIGVRCKCDRWFYQYIGFDVPAPVYAWCCLY